MNKKIYIASDHRGFEIKSKLISYLRETGFDIIDKGPSAYDENDDYPDFVSLVAREISENPDTSLGIVLGGSGQGEAMVCNRFQNVRATVYYGGNLDIIKLSREDNDSNILSLSARFLNEDETKEAVRLWLNTPFSEAERHIRRIGKIDKILGLSWK